MNVRAATIYSKIQWLVKKHDKYKGNISRLRKWNICPQQQSLQNVLQEKKCCVQLKFSLCGCLFKSDNLAQNQWTVQRTIFLLFVLLVSFLSKVDGKHSRQKSWVCLQTGIWFSASEVSSLLCSLKMHFNLVWRTKWYVFHHQRSNSKRGKSGR